MQHHHASEPEEARIFIDRALALLDTKHWPGEVAPRRAVTALLPLPRFGPHARKIATVRHTLW